MGEPVGERSRHGGLSETAENQHDPGQANNAGAANHGIAPTTEPAGENSVALHENHANPGQRYDKKTPPMMNFSKELGK
jgi:hypothetical protein